MDFKSIPKSSLLSFAALAIVIVVTWLPITDTIAINDIDTGFNRALAAFGIAKALNMAISVFQTSQIGLFGFSLAVGEVLDPVNDLIEQFSNFMLMATVAFGIQKVLVLIGGHFLVKVVLTMIAVIIGTLLLSKKKPPQWFTSLFVLMVLLRLAVPSAAILTNTAYKYFLAAEDQQSYTSLSNSIDQIEKIITTPQRSVPAINQPIAPPAGNDGLLSKAKTIIATATTFSPSDAYARSLDELNAMKTKTLQVGEQMTRDVTTQIVMFLLQTLFFPIGFVWMLYKAGVSFIRKS
jgi:hypothetical protein